MKQQTLVYEGIPQTFSNYFTAKTTITQNLPVFSNNVQNNPFLVTNTSHLLSMSRVHFCQTFIFTTMLFSHHPSFFYTNDFKYKLLLHNHDTSSNLFENTFSLLKYINERQFLTKPYNRQHM